MRFYDVKPYYLPSLNVCIRDGTKNTMQHIGTYIYTHQLPIYYTAIVLFLFLKLFYFSETLVYLIQSDIYFKRKLGQTEYFFMSSVR